MNTHTRRIATGTALLTAIALGGCVKVRTLAEASSAEAVPAADDAPVSIYAATNPFELAEVGSTSSQLLDETETVGHLMVTRSIVGWTLRADDEHIIEVAKKRARRMGGDAIVVLRWRATDVRHVDIAAMPVPMPNARTLPSAADRWIAIGTTAAFNPVTALPIYANGALVHAIVRDADDIWLFGRPPVSMTARVVRTDSAAHGLGLEVEPRESRADVVQHVHEVDVPVVR